MKVVVIDDDPTGSQTVHGCPLLLRWDVETLRRALRHPSPLLFLLATQLHRAGTTVRALLDTTPPSNWLQAAPHFFSALAAPDYLWKGRELYRDLARTGIPHLRRVEALSVVERDGRARPSDDGLGGVASAQSSAINARGRGGRGTEGRRRALEPRGRTGCLPGGFKEG